MTTSIRRAFPTILTASILTILGGATAKAQLTLSGLSYDETFDGIGTALPTGWTVRTGATAISLGTAGIFDTATKTWTDTTGAFKNVASATGLTSTTTNANQAASTDRALGIRQTGSFGDPGAAFTLQIANTVGFANFSFTLDLEMLSVQTRSTTWSVQYGVGATPATFTTLYTYSDPGAFGTTTTPTLSLGANANDLDDNVWIRIVALSASTGSVNRDTFGIDQFSLTWESLVQALYWDTDGLVPGRGGSGIWDTSTANWNSVATGDGAPATFVPASPAVFGGAAGTVTIDASGVTAGGGLKFDASGYIVEGGTLTLSTSPSINTEHAAAELTTLNSVVAGSAGLSKGGAGTLVLGGANIFTGNVTLTEGVLLIGVEANLGDAENDLVFAGGKLAVADNMILPSGREISGPAAFDIPAGKQITVLGNANATTLSLSGGGDIALNGATPSVGAIAFADAATVSSSALEISATSITTTHLAGTAFVLPDLNLGANATRAVTVADGAAVIDLALEGAITLAGGSGSRLHKLGDGALLLAGDNSGLAGSVRIGTAGQAPAPGGTVIITNNLALGSDPTLQVHFNDGVLESTANLTGANAIPLGLSIGAGQGVPATFAGEDMEFTGTVSFFAATNGYTFGIRVDNTTTFSGEFASSTGSGDAAGLNLTGTGTLVIAGAFNSLDEAIVVNGPTLVINGALTASAASIFMDEGTLTGGGTIAGNVTFDDGSFLAPGNGAGALTFGGETVDVSGIVSDPGSFKFELGNVSASDSVVLTTGELLLGTGLSFSSFEFITIAGFGSGSYVLFETSIEIGDTFTPIAGSVGGFDSTIELSADGTDIVLNVVPEPGAAALLLGGLGLMAGRRRRR